MRPATAPLAPPHLAAAPCPACAPRDGPLSLRVHCTLRPSRTSPQRSPPQHSHMLYPDTALRGAPAQPSTEPLLGPARQPYNIRPTQSPVAPLHGPAPPPCASPHCALAPPRSAPLRSPKLRFCAAPRPVRFRPDRAVAERLRPVASSAQPRCPPHYRNLPGPTCQHTTSRGAWAAQAQQCHGSVPLRRPSPGSGACGQTAPCHQPARPHCGQAWSNKAGMPIPPPPPPHTHGPT